MTWRAVSMCLPSGRSMYNDGMYDQRDRGGNERGRTWGTEDTRGGGGGWDDRDEPRRNNRDERQGLTLVHISA